MSGGVQFGPSSAVTPQFLERGDEVKDLLDNKKFGAADFWEGYKLYCFAYYSHCGHSKWEFKVTKMGRIMSSLQNNLDVPWGAQFDVTIREVWSMMEEYVWLRKRKDCTNLSALMDEFDDVKKLSTCKNGCLLLQVIQDDEHGSERVLRDGLQVHFNIGVFDGVRARLNRAEANLADLATRTHLAKRLKR